ncbi:MAG: RNA polymerase sigma factor [Pseudomonadales bacterium]|nr:RNA polymerase sigma factor [Pseudomonadales bacterium]
MDIGAFLRSIERRGFLMARMALGNDDDALDAMQDTMMRLVQRYANRPAAEWRPLFYRILRNRITDTRRRRTIRSRLFGWLEQREDEEEQDPLERIADPAALDPGRIVAGNETAEALMAAVARLPDRQQQAFMLRCWEGLSTAETASAMGCTEGSVKTHYSRAVHALRERLGEHYP